MQSRNFYEKNMILWYYQIRSKVVSKVHGALIRFQEQRQKHYHYEKLESVVFMQCIIAKKM